MQRLAIRLVGSGMLVLLMTAASLAADAPARGARRVRRLPNYYGKVVTDPQQREKILQVQDEYAPKIEALRKQITALEKERNEKVAAVLTPDQKKQIDEAKQKAAQEAKNKKVAIPAPKEAVAKPAK